MSGLWIYDEVARFAVAVPDPKRGGTWLYCLWTEPVQGGASWCLFRTKCLKTYRRHWRRHHQ